MKPLKQWICDVCGGIIEKPEDGYVIWNEDEEYRTNQILIIHQTICDKNDRKYPSSLPLSCFLGDEGKVKLLSLIDPGPYFTSEYRENIANMRSFIEVFRRLHIPYYEEARLYWNAAMADGFFVDANEVWMYLPENLKTLIERYK